MYPYGQRSARNMKKWNLSFYSSDDIVCDPFEDGIKWWYYSTFVWQQKGAVSFPNDTLCECDSI